MFPIKRAVEAKLASSGGPGGSGIGQVLRGGHHVRTILSAGPDADKKSAKVLHGWMHALPRPHTHGYEDSHQAKPFSSTSISSASTRAASITLDPR